MAPESIKCIQKWIFDDINTDLTDEEIIKEVTETDEDLIQETRGGKKLSPSTVTILYQLQTL